MIKLFETAAAFVFDGAGRWVLMLGGVAAVIGGFFLSGNRTERLTRESERGAVISEVRGKTDATIEKMQKAARGAGARGPDGRSRGVLDPTTRD
jgi:hypothetical protein